MGMIGCFAAVNPQTLEDLVSNPEGLVAYLFPEEDDEPPNSIDIEKSWHGMHYMLAGASYGGEGPLALAVLGGEPIGEDLGYGPARFLTADQVKAVAAALDALGEEGFRSRYAPQAMEDAQIYPDIWVREGDEALDYVMHYYRHLVAFYADAAQRGDGALLWLN